MSDNRSLSSSESSSDEEGWLDANPNDDEEPQTIISLVDDKVFPDAESMLAYCKNDHGLDFIAIRDRLQLDFYGCVKLINFIRQRVKKGLSVPSDIAVADIDQDEYLKPVLDDDALIFCLDSLPELQSEQQHNRPEESPAKSQEGNGGDPVASSLKQKNEELQTELESLTRQFENYRLAVQQTLDQRWGADDDQKQESKATFSQKESGKETSGGSDYYFESYAHNEIHETMLKDTIRTDAYRDFIYGHKDLFAGKVVLDIGCGTGILSMFCAKAGAKLVISVDRSDIIDKARANIFSNGLGDQIKCFKGLIEEVQLPVDKVDIIVSEWMGYGLLYEAMLPSVIYARDKYLKPDGILVPSHASLWVAPACDSEYICDCVAFWRGVYGFDMKAMQTGIYDDVRVLTMPERTVCGKPSMFKYLDLHTVTVADLVFNAKWESTLSESAESLDGFIVWFDIYFGTSRDEQIVPVDTTAREWAAAGKGRVYFSTGPFTKETHWKQCFLLIKGHSEQLKNVAGQKLSGEIEFSIPQNTPRALTLQAKWAPSSGEVSCKALTGSQSWALK